MPGWTPVVAVVVEAVTGTGKTTVGVIAAADAVARRRRVLVVVLESTCSTSGMRRWRAICRPFVSAGSAISTKIRLMTMT